MEAYKDLPTSEAGIIVVQIDNESEGIAPGQTICGTISLSLNQNFQAKNISIGLFGHEATRYKNHVGLREIIKVSHILKDIPESSHKLGHFNYPF